MAALHDHSILVINIRKKDGVTYPKNFPSAVTIIMCTDRRSSASVGPIDVPGGVIPTPRKTNLELMSFTGSIKLNDKLGSGSSHTPMFEADNGDHYTIPSFGPLVSRVDIPGVHAVRDSSRALFLCLETHGVFYDEEGCAMWEGLSTGHLQKVGYDRILPVDMTLRMAIPVQTPEWRQQAEVETNIFGLGFGPTSMVRQIARYGAIAKALIQMAHPQVWAAIAHHLPVPLPVFPFPVADILFNYIPMLDLNDAMPLE